MIKHGKSCQDFAMLHCKKTSRYVRTCMIFAWLQETRSWQDFYEGLTMTWQDIPSCKNSKATYKM